MNSDFPFTLPGAHRATQEEIDRAFAERALFEDEIEAAAEKLPFTGWELVPAGPYKGRRWHSVTDAYLGELLRASRSEWCPSALASQAWKEFERRMQDWVFLNDADRRQFVREVYNVEL